VENARLLGVAYQVMHRHGSEWVRLEARQPHDPAAADPEREWSTGTVYACPRCDEQVMVVPETGRQQDG